ncbi:MAG TPA: hypothetical protein VFC46_12625 [Humisphaera sp.]|nr:hypothetical protein [Humisphaera sp.]
MALFHPKDPAAELRNVGEANPAEQDTPRWFAYIAVAITLVSMAVGLAMVAVAIYMLFHRH